MPPNQDFQPPLTPQPNNPLPQPADGSGIQPWVMPDTPATSPVSPVPPQPTTATQPVVPQPVFEPTITQPVPPNYSAAVPQPISQPTASMPQLPQSNVPPAFATSPASSWQPSPQAMAMGSPDAQPIVQPVMASAGQPPKRKRRWLKLSIFIVLPLLLLGGGGAYAYFGVYMGSDYVWKESLGHMNGGYSQLTSYLDTQSTTKYKGVKEDGTFNVVSGGNNFDGNLNIQNDGSSSTGSLKLDLGVGKVDVEERGITPSGATTPDFYLQVSGIKNVASALGTDFGPKINSLDGQWVAVDHNLIADFENQAAKAQKAQDHPTQLTWADLKSFLQAAGSVDQKYVFTTDQKYAVTKVLKTYGKEAVGGHQTYHYQLGFNKTNVKSYIAAMCTAFTQSALNTYFKQQVGSSFDISTSCKDAEQSTDNIKASDTIDAWADINTRLLYKVRINDTSAQDPAENYVDIGLDYKGGTSYPLFISGQTKDSSSNAEFFSVATIDSKSNKVNVSLHVKDTGDAPYELALNLTFQPTNDTIQVTAPTGAKSITDVLNQLGLGDYVQTLQSLGTNATTINKKQPTPKLPSTLPLGLLTSAIR